VLLIKTKVSATMATNLSDKEINELVEICKELGLDSNDYLTARNKPRAKAVLIKAIEKFKALVENKKPYKADPINKNIKISMGDIDEGTVAAQRESMCNVEINEINEIIWTLEKNSDTNTNYKQVKDRLKNIITRCHNLLRDEKSVVGTKAQNDIMKILTIHILQPQFQNEESELYKKCKEVSQEKYNKYMPYCCDINNISKTEYPLDEWKNLVNNFLKSIFNGIYAEEDSAFNFGKDERTLMKLIGIVGELKIDKDFIDAFSTSFGDIHEAFREYSGGKGAKELGQFFTPRHLIHAILHGCGLNDMIKAYDNPSIYDPCMGTGGLLTRGYSNGNILPSNIYGCETERDTIKFGQISTLLATGEFSSNLQLCNSLCDNKFIGTKKFDVIFTNPPFGTSMKYKDIENKFNNNKEINGINTGINFKDVYPIDTNNGACLFTEHCISMLEENGTCAIVLPDGELFVGNKFKKFREYMCKNVNIIKIVSVSGKAFEHTAIKTAVIIFKKNGSTENIEFLDIPDDCNSVKRLMIIPINNIKNNNYNLSYNAYIKTEERQYNDGVVVKTLGEVCDIQNGYSFKSTDYENQNETNIGILQIKSIKNGFIDENKITEYIPESSKYKLFEINKGDILIALSGATTGKIGIYNLKQKSYLNQRVGKINAKNGIIQKYIYYWYLCNSIGEIILGLAQGTAQPNISTGDISKIKIPIPPLERQMEIVEECEQITKSIDTIKLRKEQLKSDGILFKKYFKYNEINEIYKNSDVKTLGEVCSIDYGTRIVKGNNDEGQYPVYGSGRAMFSTKTFNREGFNILIGRFALSLECVRFINEKIFLNDSGLTVKPKKENLLHKYIGYYLLHNQKIIYNLARGTAQKNLDIDEFKSIKIPIPSLENQVKIVAYYEEMNDEYKKHILDRIEEYNKELEMLKGLCVNMFHL
jgi:type I restriction enzyme, S subunit